MTDALISIAAGESQLGLLSAAAARGLAVIGVDRAPAPMGAPLCAAMVRASTHDPEEILAGLRPLSERFRFRGVMTQSSGPPVATAARVAKELGLPGLDPVRASMSISKAGFAELCREADVRTPRTWVLSGPEELHALNEEAGGWPLVLKPSRGAVGKRGVVRAAAPDDRREAYTRALAGAADGVVVAQEWISGADVAVVALFQGGRTRVVATLDERVESTADGEALGVGVDVPSELAGTPAMAAAEQAVERLAARLGTGLGFFAFRVGAPAARGEAEPYAIEAHLDLAGDFVTDVLLARGAGIHLAELGLALHVDGELRPSPAPRPARLTFLYGDDVPQLDQLAERGEFECGLPPIGDHAGGRIGWLLERGDQGR